MEQLYWSCIYFRRVHLITTELLSSLGQKIDCRVPTNGVLHNSKFTFFTAWWAHCFCTPKHKQPHANLHKGERWGSNVQSSPQERLTDSTAEAAATRVLLTREVNPGAKASFSHRFFLIAAVYPVLFKKGCPLLGCLNTDLIISFVLSQLLLGFSKTPWMILLELYQ